MLASTPSRLNGIHWLALYMKREHLLSTSYNPRTMQGYKYPVLLYYGSAKIGEREVTLDNIWCDNMGILSSYNTAPPIRRLKDLCLSFTLFHLVVRRYFGYTCPESKLDKTPDLVFDGLLQEEQDYERAFQVIEAELGFLYDFFFTNPIETKFALSELMEEAEGVLQGLMSPTEKYEKLRGLHNVAIETRHEELLAKGVMLGKALESIGNHRVRWDVLADFWVEMLVYIAPSDNVASHIEHLAEGGEFVTHVWTLLMHAGILERPAPAAAAAAAAVP
ncbi:hypothetical protein ZWY2020_027253 [Hordeum vulgare]|nr:hypothetical protein ZWY2020_027253 [Hordeum vulgare]